MNYLETSVYRLSTLSPIHIQAGKLGEYGQGFIRLNPTDDFLYVVDTPRLQADIYASTDLDTVEKYAKEYAKAFGNPGSRRNIVEVLKKIGYDYRSKIKKITKGIVRIPSGNRFIRSGLDKYFVPGSSIKGAVKTAVLYDQIKRQIDEGNLDLQNFVKNQITAYLSIQYPHDSRRQRRERENFKRRFADQLLKDAFQSKHPKEYPWITPWVDRSRIAEVMTSPGSQGTTLKTLEGNEVHLPLDKIFITLNRGNWIRINAFAERGEEQIVDTFTKIGSPPNFSVTQNQSRNKEPAGPFTDIFRAIKVKDAIIEQTVAFEDILFTKLSGQHIVRKAVGGNTRFECFRGESLVEISIDHTILDSFKRAGATPPFSDIKSLVTLCQNFAQAQWDAEKQFFLKYPGGTGINLNTITEFYADTSKAQCATLRVGWGTGMLGMTVSLLLDELTRIDLRNEIISGGHHNYPGQPAPKSRRFVLESTQPAYPLGWVALKEK